MWTRRAKDKYDILASSMYIMPRNCLHQHCRAPESLCIYFFLAAVNTPVVYLFKGQESAVHVFHQPSLATDTRIVKINRAKGHEGQYNLYI